MPGRCNTENKRSLFLKVFVSQMQLVRFLLYPLSSGSLKGVKRTFFCWLLSLHRAPPKHSQAHLSNHKPIFFSNKQHTPVDLLHLLPPPHSSFSLYSFTTPNPLFSPKKKTIEHRQRHRHTKICRAVQIVSVRVTRAHPLAQQDSVSHGPFFQVKM